MTSKFSGKVALVTGGTGGLGRAVTLALLHEGASVIATYIKKDEADALQDAVGPKCSLWNFCRWTPQTNPLAAHWWMESRRAMAISIFWSTQLAAMPAEKQFGKPIPKPISSC